MGSKPHNIFDTGRSNMRRSTTLSVDLGPSSSLRSISASHGGCACIARGRQFSFANLARFWHVLNFFWSTLEKDQLFFFKKKKKPKIQHPCEAWLCQNICFWLYAFLQISPPLLSEVTSRSQSSGIWPEIKLAWNNFALPPQNATGFEGMVLFSKSKFSKNPLTFSRLFSVAPGTAGKTATSWQNYTIEIAGRRAQFNTH